MEQTNPVQDLNTTQGDTNTKDDNALSVFVEQESTLADSMISILKDNISKVQQNPAYMQQAQVINNNVNSVINIMKMKLQFVKEVKRKK